MIWQTIDGSELMTDGDAQTCDVPEVLESWARDGEPDHHEIGLFRSIRI
jgi:hypothetical protein